MEQVDDSGDTIINVDSSLPLKKVGPRVWDFFQPHLAFTIAAFNL